MTGLDAALRQVDSRRLPGPNLFTDRGGAILDFAGGEAAARTLVARWRVHARALLDEVGWLDENLHARTFPGGGSVVLSAPPDALYAATEVNEAAFAAACAELAGGPPPDLSTAVAALQAKIAAEQDPRRRALRDECQRRNVAFVADDLAVSIGMGRGALVFAAKELPDPAQVDWRRVHDVPVALITGTNGKSTTVRLLGAMARAAGKVAGLATTDWVKVGGKLVDAGDYSGPSGARLVLRDPATEVALLETARGGMLRRGLVLRRVDAACITNVTADHLGEFGVATLDDLVDAKLIVRRAVPGDGRLVLNAEDPRLVARAAGLAPPLAWFARDGRDPFLVAQRGMGRDVAFVEDGRFVLVRAGRREEVLPVADAPITFGGAAPHNVLNVLAALLVGARLGFAPSALAQGLRDFGGGPDENPGRGNLFELGGVTCLVDFAHNPDGVRVVLELAQALPARRRLLIIGQAGDRDDASIADFARAAAAGRPDFVIIKEMEKYLRGRAPGVVPALLEAEFRRAGLPATALARADSEYAAVERALAWAQPGDLLILLTHAERDAVLALLKQKKEEGWRPRASPGP